MKTESFRPGGKWCDLCNPGHRRKATFAIATRTTMLWLCPRDAFQFVSAESGYGSGLSP